MKKILLAASIALGMASLALATTTDELMVCINGASCITVTDNGVGDVNPATNTITYINANFHGWNLKAITGDSGSPSNINPALDVSTLTATCVAATGCGTNTLDVLYSDINFNIAAATGGWTNAYSATITGTSTGSTSQLAWVDTSNTIFGMPAGGALPVAGPLTTTGASVTTGGPGVNPLVPGGAVSAPYSVTLEQTFTDNGTVTKSGLTFSTDGSVAGTPVPEPGAIILLGGVLVLTATKLRRRQAS